MIYKDTKENFLYKCRLNNGEIKILTPDKNICGEDCFTDGYEYFLLGNKLDDDVVEIIEEIKDINIYNIYQSKINALEWELNEVLDVLYKASPKHLDWIRINYPNWRKDELNNSKI